MPAAGVLEQAMRLGSLCDSAEVDMVLITGSVARGLSDRSSDIDLYVYRPAGADTSHSMRTALGPSEATLVFGVATSTGQFEKFRLGDRYVDVEQVMTETLHAMADRIHAGEVTASDVKVAAGLSDALAVVGTQEFEAWRERLVLNDRVAVAEVARLSTGLLSPRALYDLTWARSDELSYVARVSKVLLAGIGLLGAVNRRWIAVDDPKWLPWQVERLALKPRDTRVRLREAIRKPTEHAADDAAALLTEILDLADEHIDGADTRVARFALQL